MVYGSNNTSDREQMWDGLQISSTTDPWIVLGDFNVEPSTRVWSKLDRVLVNPSWISSLPNSFAHFSESGISDHSPVIVYVSEDRKIKKSISAKVKAAKDGLTDCQARLAKDPFSEEFIHEEKIKIQEYRKFKAAELSIFSQRAKIKHIQEADSSSKYFFAKISARKHQQQIGEYPVQQLNADFLAQGATISFSESSELDASISLKEDKDDVFSMDSNSSPGIDGFSAGFFKSAWAIIGLDLFKVVRSFFKTSFMPKQANSTVLSLIPKKVVPSSVLDYRPISCCIVFYKVISKILASRRQKVLPSLIGNEQAAFI
ncbi:uncharacterized protein LOC141629018 [Silene latifolia]|uniref:uncharacterized protein LOC141629018 n=1 Tax=Silene latifolia TaxID=37657 RepID=UPI003D786988